MAWFIFFIVCSILIFGSIFCKPKEKKNNITQFQFGNSNSNSQISIGNSNSCSTSNINGHIKITGNIKSLTVNGKRIEL